MVDDDTAETQSLQSSLILDLWTDEIVAEYTGRPSFANDYYEQLRRLLILYNATDNYENNKKGLFAYYQRMNSSYLLTDTLEFLKDKDMIKGQPFGNKSKGTVATLPINTFARTLSRDWLLKPTTVIRNIDGVDQEVQVPALQKLKGRALIKELIQWNADGNYDRVSALGMLMLLREDRLILSGGNVEVRDKSFDSDYLGNDKFFSRNYDSRFKKSVNLGN